jgi:hypothetical protein
MHCCLSVVWLWWSCCKNEACRSISSKLNFIWCKLCILGYYVLGPDFSKYTAFYLLAKVEEAADKPIYRWTHQIVSGHTLKHLCAAMVPVFLTLMLAKRTIEPERYVKDCLLHRSHYRLHILFLGWSSDLNCFYLLSGTSDNLIFHWYSSFPSGNYYVIIRLSMCLKTSML